jgi:hypothetical protein
MTDLYVYFMLDVQVNMVEPQCMVTDKDLKLKIWYTGKVNSVKISW